MKTIYIILSRSGTLLSHMVSTVTDDKYTHASLAFDESLTTLYSSSRKNGYTMFPAGPCREFLNRGVFSLHEDIPCAVYALEVSDEVYSRALRRAERYVNWEKYFHFNIIGLLLCWLNIRMHRRHHYFCSQFVGEVLASSGALALPKDASIMRPADYSRMPQLRCVYRGRLHDLPQRQHMEISEPVGTVTIYTRLFILGMYKRLQHFYSTFGAF